MLSYLLIAPSPTCQHGNRKLHRRQLPRNLSPVFRIMKRHPAPAERNHPFRDTLIRLRISIPDTSLDQPPQKPMMLNKRLQKPIHLRQLPAPEHLLLRLLLMLSVYRTHRHHTMDIRHTDRIRPLRHKQSSLTHPISTPYLPVKISMVSHHIRGKKPQPLRKHPAVLPKSRHLIRRQMKQNRPHIPRQKTGRINIRRNLFLHSQLQTGLDSLHPPLSRRHIPQRQIRIPIQNTRRKPQLNNPAGQIPPRDLTTLLSPPRKIKKLSPRNIPQIKTQAAPKKTTLKTRPTQTSEALHPSHINTHPKPITHPSSIHIRSSSLKPHQHTSEAHLSTLISTHPKLISQPSSAYIRSSSLKPHQRTSEALLSSHISTHPKLISQVPQNSHQNSGYQSTIQPVNQSGQPSFSIIIIQNPPKINLNITQKHHTLSKTASIPNPPTTPPKKTHPTHIQRSADATPPPGTSQVNSAPAAIQRSVDGPPPSRQTTTPHTSQKPERTDCQRGGCMVGTRCVGVSRWSYLAPEAPGETTAPGTTLQPPRWQTVRSSLPPFIPQKKSPQAQTPGNSPKTKQHHLPLRNFLSSLSNRSARAFSLNVFTLSSLRPCSIP